MSWVAKSKQIVRITRLEEARWAAALAASAHAANRVPGGLAVALSG